MISIDQFIGFVSLYFFIVNSVDVCSVICVLGESADEWTDFDISEMSEDYMLPAGGHRVFVVQPGKKTTIGTIVSISNNHFYLSLPICLSHLLY